MFNRGMGVISLRSYNYSGNWLKIQDGQLLGKVMKQYIVTIAILL